MTVATHHPFAAEAPDAENVWVATGLDRQVTPEGAIAASDRHVWLLVTDIDVSLLSTPAFREWLDATFSKSTEMPDVQVHVIPAARPWTATPMRVRIVHNAPFLDSQHHVEVLAASSSSYLPFMRYPRLR